MVVARAKRSRGEPRAVDVIEPGQQAHDVVEQDAVRLSPKEFHEIVEVFRLLHQWRLEAER